MCQMSDVYLLVIVKLPERQKRFTVNTKVMQQEATTTWEMFTETLATTYSEVKEYHEKALTIKRKDLLRATC